MFTKESQLYKPDIIEKMRKNPENVEDVMLKAPIIEKIDTSLYKAVLIDAPTQAGKTRKCFSVMQEKLKLVSKDGKTLVLFITQANSTAGASQVKQRASNDPAFANFDIQLHPKETKWLLAFGIRAI